MRKIVKAEPPIPRGERTRYHLARWWWVAGLALVAEAGFSFSIPGGPDLETLIGVLIQNALILCVFWVLLYYYRRETYRDLRQVAMIGSLFTVMILAAAVVARVAPAHPELIPLPLFAMILTVQFNGRVSMIGAMILSALIDVQPVFHDGPALFVCLAGGITAALSVRILRRRSHLSQNGQPFFDQLRPPAPVPLFGRSYPRAIGPDQRRDQRRVLRPRLGRRTMVIGVSDAVVIYAF